MPKPRLGHSLHLSASQILPIQEESTISAELGLMWKSSNTTLRIAIMTRAWGWNLYRPTHPSLRTKRDAPDWKTDVAAAGPSRHQPCAALIHTRPLRITREFSERYRVRTRADSISLTEFTGDAEWTGVDESSTWLMTGWSSSSDIGLPIWSVSLRP